MEISDLSTMTFKGVPLKSGSHFSVETFRADKMIAGEKRKLLSILAAISAPQSLHFKYNEYISLNINI